MLLKQWFNRNVGGLGLVASLMSLTPVQSNAADWNFVGGGQWRTSGNWTGGVPNSTSGTAGFTTDNNLHTINLRANLVNAPGSYTISELQLGGTGTGGYIFTYGTINFNAPGSGPAAFSLASGNSSLGSGGILNLVDNTTFTIAEGASFTIASNAGLLGSGGLIGSGNVVLEGQGDLILNSISLLYVGDAIINGGTLTMGVTGALGAAALGANDIRVDNTALNSATLKINAGVIVGNEITLNQGGKLINEGVVLRVTGDGVNSSTGGGIVENINGGNIGGGNHGINFLDGGLITNTDSNIGGLVGNGVNIVGDVGFVINENGIIIGNNGVYLGAGGQVDNSDGASIEGFTGNGVFIEGGPGTVYNDNAEIVGVNAGVALFAGGTVRNENAGSITGDTSGIYVEGLTAIFNATGAEIIGGVNGILFDGSSNGLVANADARITGQTGDGIYFSGTGVGSVFNSTNAVIEGSDNGVTLSNGGFVLNFEGANITGSGFAGIEIYGAAGEVINDAATVNGSTYGVGLYDGGSVSNTNGGGIFGEYGVFGDENVVVDNSAGAVIEGARTGVLLDGGGLIINSNAFITGLVENGVELTVGGAVQNLSGGSLEGLTNGALFRFGGSVLNDVATITGLTFDGVVVEGAAGSVVNQNGGIIRGNNSGVVLRAGGSVTNRVNSIITGYTESGIVIESGDGTVVNAGRIEGRVLLDGSATNSVTLFDGSVIIGDLFIGTNAGSSLILDGAGAQNYTAAVIGTTTHDGGLIKQGSGTWTIDTPLLHSGLSEVREGTLEVSSFIAGNALVFKNAELNVNGQVAGDVSVNYGGTLSGAGFIGGSVVNTGFVSPGNSPGTLSIAGNYTQSSSGTLVAEINSFAPGGYDRLVVSGDASLSGRLLLVPDSNLAIEIGDRAEILTAGGTVTGEFNTVIDGVQLNSILQANVLYFDSSVVIEIEQGSFEAFVKDNDDAFTSYAYPGALTIARALDDVASDSREADLISYLNDLSLSEIPNALQLLAPPDLSVIYQIGVATADVQASHFSRRTSEIHRGIRRSSPVVAELSEPASAKGAKAVQPVSSKNSKAVEPVQQAADPRWTTYFYGNAQFLDLETGRTTTGYGSETGGLTAGADYAVNDNLTVGLLVSGAVSSAELFQGGDVDVKSGQLGVYATYHKDGFYVDGLVGGAYNEYDIDRDGLGGRVRGDTDGSTFDALLATGYEFKQGGFRYGPVASLHYTRVNYDGYTESGSRGPLEIQSNDSESLRSALGVEAAFLWETPMALIVPQLRATWQHEFGDQSQTTQARFASGAGNVFSVNGPEIGRDSLQFGVAVAFYWTPSLATTLAYDAQFGRKDYSAQSVSLSVSWSF